MSDETNPTNIKIRKCNVFMPYCEQCGNEHDGTFGSGRFCNRSCSNRFVALNQSKEAKERKVAKGINNLSHTWAGRSCSLMGNPTKSEKFVIELLNSLNINYIQEFTISKKSLGLNGHGNYSLDFYFKDKKLDLEIDGTTHLKPERKERDLIRDDALVKNGYHVRRIFFDGNYNDLREKVIKILMEFNIYCIS